MKLRSFIGTAFRNFRKLAAPPGAAPAIDTEAASTNIDLPWQQALQGLQVGVARWNLSSGRGHWSARWGELFECSGLDIHLDFWLAGLRPADAGRIREFLVQLDAAPPATRIDQFSLELRRAGQPRPWLSLRAEVLQRDASGRAGSLLATCVDASAQHAAGDRQRVSAQMFARLQEGLVITDLQHRVLEANPAYCEITGIPRAELVGSVPGWLLQPTGPEQRPLLTLVNQSLFRHGRWQGDIVERRRNGDPCALRLNLSTVLGVSGTPKYVMMAVSDVTLPWRQRDQIERVADYDGLTQLPNRARLMRLLAQAIAAADRDGFLLTICHVDLDHFKAVNDRHGPEAGDRALVEIASRLQGALRGNAHWPDSVARLGGDEFVLLLRSTSVDESRQAVERVLRVIAQPSLLVASGEPEELSASVGATVYPHDRADAETLLRHADHALFEAKQAGRQGCVFFDPERQRRTAARVLAVGRVEEALNEGELRLHYQPKVNMRTGEVLGVEALLRWQHPEQGLIPPGQFLPLIEPTSLGVRIGEWVFETAVAQLAAWRAQGLKVSVSVNVSARHLQAYDFAPRLEHLLAAHPPDLAHQLELEVLETAALADVDSISELMQRLRDSGVRFSLDDFGTGYSNLSYLKRLPVDVLKIDRSFVHGMLQDEQDQAIVEGVIALAGAFGCSVIAEGVESVEQARRLIAVGCELGQGLGIAAPMPADDIPAFVHGHRAMLAGPQRVAL